MWLFYNGVIYLMQLVFNIAALVNPKAKKWIKGREKWRDQLLLSTQNWDGEHNRVWMHCASLGEFEQGRPLLEKLRSTDPGLKIILTFFSPSGYEIRKNYPNADLVCYLPIDTTKNAKDFIRLSKPDVAIFVKYEFWFNYLKELKKAKTPHFLIAGVFRSEQHFFKPYGRWFRKALNGFTHFFVQDQTSANLLQGIGVNAITLAGDPRIDRVLAIAEQAPRFPEVEAFINGRQVLVAGSTWPPDEDRLLPFIQAYLPEDWCLILAPHDIKSSHLASLENQINSSYIKYSQLKLKPSNPQILLIDNIGMLSSLYQYGKIAYIGGGFGQGIHNTLEPMAFQLPVLFGPKYGKFAEARFLEREKAGFTYQTKEELKDYFFDLQNLSTYEKATGKIKTFLAQNAGATDIIYRFGQQNDYWS
ncbi:MAG: glycosyltransferase N-terminal domain-containing protein [Saprospiraceae bacterium]